MGGEIEIQIDIFSGRPNPTFKICGIEAVRLKNLLEHIRPRLDRRFSGDDLGFRGFVVQAGSGSDYRVLGDVLAHDGDVYADPKHEAQDYIVSLLPKPMKNLVQPFLVGLGGVR